MSLRLPSSYSDRNLRSFALQKLPYSEVEDVMCEVEDENKHEPKCTGSKERKKETGPQASKIR
jgi:hypothetical protein